MYNNHHNRHNKRAQSCIPQIIHHHQNHTAIYLNSTHLRRTTNIYCQTVAKTPPPRMIVNNNDMIIDDIVSQSKTMSIDMNSRNRYCTQKEEENNELSMVLNMTENRSQSVPISSSLKLKMNINPNTNMTDMDVDINGNESISCSSKNKRSYASVFDTNCDSFLNKPMNKKTKIAKNTFKHCKNMNNNRLMADDDGNGMRVENGFEGQKNKCDWKNFDFTFC